MTAFVGRSRELAALDHFLDDARAGQGVLISMRGRRQVGKSRLVGEFVARSGAPVVFFTASRQPSAAERAIFAEAVHASGTPSAATPAGAQGGSWEAALLLATADAAPGP